MLRHGAGNQNTVASALQTYRKQIDAGDNRQVQHDVQPVDMEQRQHAQAHVTGPLREWREMSFSIYYLLLFCISGLIVHHFQKMKISPASSSLEAIC